MAQDNVIATCRWCCEQMHAQAWRCPHCRMWQSRLHGLCKSTCAILIVGTAVACALPMMLLLSGIMSLFEKGADFADHHDQLRVVGSSMFTGSREGEPIVAVVGTLRNDTGVKWRGVSLEVQFKDDDGKLVDVTRTHLGWRTLLPAAEVAFRADTVADLALEKYAAYEVFVRSAWEAKGLF